MNAAEDASPLAAQRRFQRRMRWVAWTAVGAFVAAGCAFDLALSAFVPDSATRLALRWGVLGAAGVLMGFVAPRSLLAVSTHQARAQHDAEMALRESEQRYRALVETAPVPIAVHSQGRLRYLNGAALSLVGAARAADVLGRPVLDLVHPDSRPSVVERSLRALAEGLPMPPAEQRLLRLDGSVVDAEVTTTPVTFEGRPAMQVVVIDLTARKQAERQLRHQALHDSLTDLPNRLLLQDHLRLATRDAAGGRQLALLVVDLDHFKEVNDTCGHRYGDLVLCAVAARWRSLLDERWSADDDARPVLARLSGDEFAVLAPGADAAAGLALGRALGRALDAPVRVEGHAFQVGASVGVAAWPSHGEDGETLLRRADMAMYVAKSAGLGCVLFEPAHERQRPPPRRLKAAGALPEGGRRAA